jgi:hypothetical protein
MGQRSQLEDAQTVVCLGCSFESIEPDKKPGQKYPKRCPNCGRFAADNQRQAARDARIKNKEARNRARHRGGVRLDEYQSEYYKGFAAALLHLEPHIGSHALIRKIVEKEDVGMQEFRQVLTEQEAMTLRLIGVRE